MGKSKVFRLRNVPGDMDRLAATRLLCKLMGGIPEQDVHLSSLAWEVDRHSSSRTKTATLTFSTVPTSIKDRDTFFTDVALSSPLIIDDHFQGVTPLNDVPDHTHVYDCIILSGLGSHPFGSWQPHGHDKSFMWIRDELPKRLPNTRFLIYGYDTTLLGSHSFQGITDLANLFIQMMITIGYSAPSSKPVIFLAHSLGGVVLKQALVTLAAGYSRELAVQENIKGAMFFGTPSYGMSIPDLYTMLGSQPNTALLKELSDESQCLPLLDEEFGGISYLQKLQFCWVYETKITPTVEAASTPGTFARTGTPYVMVPPESATRGLYRTEPSLTLPIDENHSNMVKFGQGDHRIDIIANKLGDICKALESTYSTQPPLFEPLSMANNMVPSQGHSVKTSIPSAIEPSKRPEIPVRTNHWNHKTILQSLRAAERDQRLEHITERIGNTFDWAFDEKSVGLVQWLQEGKNIFWIRGKPGSGKSTLMKYLYQDPRTSELLRTGSWKLQSKLVTASFFFHHRGNNIQKSFEGLLCSLISQILEQQGSLFPFIYAILDDQYRNRVQSEDLGSFEGDIREILEYFGASGGAFKVLDDQSYPQPGNRHLTEAYLRNILNQVGISNAPSWDSFMRPGMKSKGKAEWIRWTLGRHIARAKIKTNIETEVWTRDHLENALHCLITQDAINMDICLFLDALDEYDGRPEFIASFLKDLIIHHSSPKTQGLSTRLRVLFSSRPWNFFNSVFSSYPGIQIHDHTQTDMKEFCVTFIPHNDSALALLSPLVPEIVKRARGVFLWTKLVMADLVTLLEEDTAEVSTNNLAKRLRTTLDSLPSELHQFYRLIIERIPGSMRWESYVVMESISRSYKVLKYKDVINTLSICPYTSPQGKVTAYDGSSSQRLQRQREAYIETVTGGLVEIIPRRVKGVLVQFIHQSVKDFIQDPRLKSLLMGTEHARLIHENGNSFLAQYYFQLSVPFRYMARYHLYQVIRYHQKAEESTGYSQYNSLEKCFRQMKGKSYQIYNYGPSVLNQLGFLLDQENISVSSVLGLAVTFGLPLCINDACKANPHCIETYSGKSDLILVLLLSSLCRPQIEKSRILATAKSLIENGLTPQASIDGFCILMEAVWVPLTGVKWPRKTVLENNFFESLAVLLVDAWPDDTIITSNTELPDAPNRQGPTASRSLALTERLLRRGFDPSDISTLKNTESFGQTPLDYILKLTLNHDDNLAIRHQYDHVCLFIRWGGRLRITSRSRWDTWTRECTKRGLDIQIFEEKGFPLWIEQQNPFVFGVKRFLVREIDSVIRFWT